MVREIKGLKCPNHDRIRDGHHFTSLKSRSTMRLFRRIRYIGVRVRRFLNQLVEKILLYDDGITCILPKDETYDED